MLRGSAVPYGYTLTVLATHSILAHSHGQPTVFDIGLFVAGALAGFATLGGLSRAGEREALELGEGVTITVGMANVVAIAIALAAAAGVSMLGGRIAWALGSYLATMLYLTVVSLEFAAVGSARRR